MVDAAAPPFVGRAAELDTLAALFRRVRARRPAVCIVGGEAGVGKSRLVDEFCRRARADGARVLEGACLELGGGDIPYAPFVEALRGLIRGLDEDRQAELLGPSRAELARLLPELGVARKPDRPIVEGRRRAQARLFDVVLGVLDRLADQAPVILVVEDLQWADTSTRDLLAFLARVIRDVAVLIVVTTRTDDVGGRLPLLPYLAELGRLDQVERIELGPLARPDVARLVRSALGGSSADDVIDGVYERSDGNPFYVEQLLAVGAERDGDGAPLARTGVADLPPRLRDVLLARVGGLGDQAREVLRAAAAGGRRVDDALLADVVDLPARELNAALREAVERQILVRVASPTDPAGSAYAFRHALLQEVVLSELFSGERQRLHAAFAGALAARADQVGMTSDDRPSPAEIARHWDAAHDWPRALQASVDAGYAAERAFAFAEAHRHYERALELWLRIPGADALFLGDRASLLGRAAEMAVLSGEYRRAVELGNSAVAAIPASAGPDDTRRGLFHERLRWFLWEAGDRAAAEQALETAERAVPDQPRSAARARVLGHLAGLHMYAGRYALSRREAAAALEHARAVGARTEEAMALGILGRDVALLGDVDDGVAQVREALRIALDIDNVEGIALGYTTLAALLDLVGRAEEAVRIAREGRAKVTRIGVVRTYGGLLAATEASALIRLGRWHEAETALSEGLDSSPGRRAAIALHAQAVILASGRGAFEDARHHLDAARSADDTRGGTEWRLLILVATAQLAVWQGQIDDARAAVEAGLHPPADSPAGLPVLEVADPMQAWLAVFGLRAEADAAERARARRDQATMEDAGGRGERLAEDIAAFERDRVAEAASDGITERFAAIGMLGQAELSRLHGSSDPAAWRTAGDAFQHQGRPLPEAYARYREAEARLANGEGRAAAAAALRPAAAIASHLGAHPLEVLIGELGRMARIELERAPSANVGNEPEDVGDAAVDVLGLTEREAEVLRLVAGGWTNRQIADALFISPKTASVHVSNILGKLGVDSRVEAAAIAHRLGLGRDAPSPPDAAG